MSKQPPFKASLSEMKILARALCPLCANLVPHHVNRTEGISHGDPLVRYDLHAVPCEGGVTLEECVFGDHWLAWERR